MSTEASEMKGEAPPVTPQGAPCWVEIMSVDPPKLKQFYAALFPAWKFKPGSEAYKEADVVMYEFEQPTGLSGGIVKLPEGCPRSEQPMGIGQTVYFYVHNLEDVEKKVLELGGKTVLEKKPEGTHGWFMNFKDPEGNRFGAYQLQPQKLEKQ